jgi:pyruvate/2-oxoacid:ferredoxin oxidoreductase alpha subunit
MELRYLLEEALEASPKTIVAVDEEFGAAFGRRCGGLLWSYRAEDADILMMAAGSLTCEASVAVDELRKQGHKVGVVGVRSYRPFPKAALIDATKNARLVMVFDKSLSYGNEGPICADLKAALYRSASNPVVHGYIAGLGGRDVKSRELADAVRSSIAALDTLAPERPTQWVNCQI